MATDEQPRDIATELTRSAQAKFGTLSSAETLVVEGATRGVVAVCGPNNRDDDPKNDPNDADRWGPTRRLRAEVVAWLCTDHDARKHVHWRGIQVYGADIIGSLDLSFVDIPFQLSLKHCRLTEEMNLVASAVAHLDLQGSLVHGIFAVGMVVKNAVLLSNNFRAEGEVRLSAAQIGGILVCVGGTFNNPYHKATPKSGTALGADAIRVNGSVFLRDGFNASGAVLLSSAQIGDNLDCSDGTFSNPPLKEFPGSGVALNASGIVVKGGITLAKIRVTGETLLLGGQVGTLLDCKGGVFTNPPEDEISDAGFALSADEINVRGSVLLRDGFTANGEVRLAGAEIGGDLDCSGGKFVNPERTGFPRTGNAIIAQRVVVKGGLLLRDGFTAEGTVNLTSAQIGGTFISSGGDFKAASLRLTDASTPALYDSATRWPNPQNLFLNGFVYGRIHTDTSRINVDERLGWLALQFRPPFAAQPYLQLAKILRESGDRAGSLRVLEKLEELRRNNQEYPSNRRLWSRFRKSAARLWSLILKGTIGYGLYPQRAVWGLLLLVLLGWIIYGISYSAGTITPTDKIAYDDFKVRGLPPAHYPRFSPWVYSLELSLPLVKLGQADKWQPDPATHVLVWIPRLQILFGWFLATFFVAGVSGIVHKE